MMNLQTVPSAARWQPVPRTTPRRIEPTARGSDFSEVLDLLRFEGRRPELDDSIVFQRHRIRAGESIYCMNQPFKGLYVVRFGALKTALIHSDGSEQVLAFPMKGDLLGFDGVCKNRYLSQVTALTDCDLIKLQSPEMFSGEHSGSKVERVVYWAISREIVQEQFAYASFQAAKAEARVARFLSLQSERFAAMGYSPYRITLAMTRRDIGNHLNVTLETISRAFSALDHLGIIAVERREITILSLQALRDFGN